MYTKTVYFISQISTLKMGFRAVYFITPVYFISTVYFISPPPVTMQKGVRELMVFLIRPNSLQPEEKVYLKYKALS